MKNSRTQHLTVTLYFMHEFQFMLWRIDKNGLVDANLIQFHNIVDYKAQCVGLGEQSNKLNKEFFNYEYFRSA